MLSSSVLPFFHPFPSPTFVLATTTIVLAPIGTTCCAGLERSDVTGEPRGSPCGRQGTTKFEFKSPSVHSVVRGHPITKREFRQAEIRQVL
ncbi:hypothetical protein E2C01_062833 [Portunus trituberculatus]|uniref:Uncharacterized protein n=1 Tax=Portunus trituberculatus TaxID=210409 RepID=A0A5B7HFZ6_PORTR|nr:hypothetical protein [Portunus trituberculatus]